MKKFILHVTVDEDTVKSASGEDDIMTAISTEAGWMHDSGIFLDSVEEECS